MTLPSAGAFIDSVTSRSVGSFTGGNLVVRVGVIVLFFGVAFLHPYANAKPVAAAGLISSR
ncbi:MAG: hypothetical protein WA994_09195 [Ornithinimicrobium sp.]